MTIKINYIKKTNSKIGVNYVFFTKDNFTKYSFKNFLNNKEIHYVGQILKKKKY